jgi:predicted porin
MVILKNRGYAVHNSKQFGWTFAVVSTMVATSLHAQSTAVYGQIRLTVNSVTTGDARANSVTDNASRLGFRGAENIGSGLEALYGYEFGISADEIGPQLISIRNAYVGLRGDFGTIALGGLDSGNPTGSPLYSQVTSIVAFAPNDAGATAIGTSMLNSRNRTANSIGYMSPNFGGLVARARYYFRGPLTTTPAENDASALDLGVSYAYGPLTLGVAYASDQRKGGLATNNFEDKFHGGIRYDFGFAQPYAMFGKDNYFIGTAKTRSAVNWWLVGVKAPFGPHAITANVMERDVQASLTGVRKRHQLAYTYALSKRTEFQLFYDRDGIDSSKTNVAVRAIGTGLRHDF